MKEREGDTEWLTATVTQFLMNNNDRNVFAGLLTALFRGTDLVPSDVIAGCILLRVRQKRETHELRRLNLIARPKCTSGKKRFCTLRKSAKIHAHITNVINVGR